MYEKYRNILIIVLVLLLLVALVIGVWALARTMIQKGQNSQTDDTKLVPDYPPQATDPNQMPMENDPGGKLETSAGGAGVNLTYTAIATVDLSEKKVTLYYANPSRSTQDMVVSLVVGDKVICRSQRLTPGNQIKTLPLEEGVKNSLEVGGYDAKYMVGCYDSSSGEKAVVELVGGGVVLTVVE